MDEIELFQLTFDATEVPYEDSLPPDPPKPRPAFGMKKKSNRAPKGTQQLFDPSNLDTRDSIL